MEKQNLTFSLTTILLLITTCIVFILLSPIYLFRWILSKLKIILRPDLYKIIPAFSALYLQYGIENEARSNIQTTVKLKAKIHHEDLIGKITRVFLNSKSNGKPCFPELKMFADYWYGFPFWKLESNFKLEDHLRTEKIPTTTTIDEEDFVSKYENDFLKIPFKYGKSPWEIVHLEGENSHLIFKVHHSLTDGHGMFYIFMKCVDNFVPLITPSKTTSSRPTHPCRVFLDYLTFPFCVVFDWVKAIYYSMSECHPWDICIRDMCPNTRVIIKSASVISCQKIKEGSKKHVVTFTTILLAGITGGIRHFFENTSQKVPEYMQMAIPIPSPTRQPGVLKNQFATITPRLPLGESKMSARIQTCKNELDTLNGSQEPARHLIGANVIGALPRCIFSNFKQTGKSFGFQISNFPGPPQSITFLGQPVLNMYYVAWVSNYSPVFLTLLSYNGGIQLVANADPNLFPSEDLLQNLLQEIHTEIDAIVNA